MFIKFILNKPYKHIIRGKIRLKSEQGDLRNILDDEILLFPNETEELKEEEIVCIRVSVIEQARKIKEWMEKNETNNPPLTRKICNRRRTKIR